MRSLRSLLSPAKGAKSVDPESQATTLNSSETPTVVQAENEKTDEKTAPFEATRSADDSGHEKAVSNLATKSEKEEERGNGDDDEDREYPRGLPLVIVSAGLCLAVLLVALVSRSCISSSPFLDRPGTDVGARSRTTPSSPLLLPASRISSSPSILSDGMRRLIF